MRSRVLQFERANPLNETLHSALLEDAHQGRAQSLSGIRGNLGNGCLGTRTLLDEAAGNLLELEVSGDIGGDEDVGELARGHEKLGYEIDVPVVESAILLPWLLALLVVAVFLEELDVSELEPSSSAERGSLGIVQLRD